MSIDSLCQPSSNEDNYQNSADNNVLHVMDKVVEFIMINDN